MPLHSCIGSVSASLPADPATYHSQLLICLIRDVYNSALDCIYEYLWKAFYFYHYIKVPDGNSERAEIHNTYWDSLCHMCVYVA